MKKNSKKLLTVLSLAFLVGGIAKIHRGLLDNSFEKQFLEVTGASDEFNDLNNGFELKGPRRSNSNEDLSVSDLQVQLSDVDENGNRSMRFVAAISSLNAEASFTRTIYNEDGSVFASEKTIDVTYAYESVVANGETVLPSSFGEGYNYFITYTLGNVPESHWFSKIDVSVQVNEESASRAANIEGILKGYTPDENLTYSEINESGNYQVGAKNTDITTANINEYHITYEDLVATRGKVTEIAKRGFAECQNIELLVIPSTVTYFNDLSFYNVTSIKEIRYYASQATSHSEVTMPNSSKLIFGESVKQLSRSLFVSSRFDDIEYKGTKAQWSEITNSDVFKAVKCSDTAEYKIIFHFDGATLNGQEEYSYVTYEGKTLVNPGNPEKEGVNFDGWYLDENYENKFTTVPAAFPEGTEEVHVYAKFVAAADGTDAEHPLPLVLGTNELRPVTVAAPHTYYTFTPEETDNYIFKDISSNSSSYSSIWIYDSNNNEVLKATTSNFNKTILLTKEESYLIKIGTSQTTVTKEFGIQLEVSTIAGDRLEEAQVVEFNTEVTHTFTSTNDYYYFEYTAQENENVVRIDRFNSATVYVDLYDKNTKEKLETFTINSTNTYKDFELIAGNTYVFGIASKAGTYTFALKEVPYGISLNRAIEYKLEDGTVSMPILTTNPRKSEKVTTSSSSKTYYYYEIFYKFTPTETRQYNITLSRTDSSSSNNKGFMIDMYKDGSIILTKGSLSYGQKGAFDSGELEAGKEYVLHIKCILSGTSSSAKPTSASLLIK